MAAYAKNINSEILSWARTRAGLTEEDAARAIGLKDSKKTNAVEKLRLLEKGERFPTKSQLRKIAAIYRRPLITFYLVDKPVESEPDVDFRRLHHPANRREEANLKAFLRNIRARQQLVRELILDENEAHKIDFIGMVSVEDSIQETVQKIHEILETKTYPAKKIKEPYDWFKYLRDRIQAQGIFVIQAGNLGSHHTNFPVETFRGFVLADEVAPFIVINHNDDRAARSFTLIHEFVHLLAGKSGISGSFANAQDDDEDNYSDNYFSTGTIERFCNHTASEFLLPENKISNYSFSQEARTLQDQIKTIADEHHVSMALVAYRLHQAKKIDDKIFGQLMAVCKKIVENRKEQEKEKSKDQSTKIDRYKLESLYLGELLKFTKRALHNEELTYTKAAWLLGKKNTSFAISLLEKSA